MSIEQPLHRPGRGQPPAPHPGPHGAPAYPSFDRPHPAAPPGYPPPERLGWGPLHLATPPAGLAPPRAPFAPGPPPYPGSGFPGVGGGGILAVVALVCGSVALLVSWVPWVSFGALVVAAGGLLCGVLALQRPTERRGVSVAAIATSALALVIALLMSVIVLLGVTVAPLERTPSPGGPTAPADAGSPIPDRGAPTGDPELPTRGVSNDSPSADRLFLQLLRDQDIALDDDRAVRLGREVCGSWMDGADIYDQLIAVSPVGLSDFDTGYFIGAATYSYCPGYRQELDI